MQLENNVIFKVASGIQHSTFKKEIMAKYLVHLFKFRLLICERGEEGFSYKRCPMGGRASQLFVRYHPSEKYSISNWPNDHYRNPWKNLCSSIEMAYFLGTMQMSS